MNFLRNKTNPRYYSSLTSFPQKANPCIQMSWKISTLAFASPTTLFHSTHHVIYDPKKAPSHYHHSNTSLPPSSSRSSFRRDCSFVIFPSLPDSSGGFYNHFLFFRSFIIPSPFFSSPLLHAFLSTFDHQRLSTLVSSSLESPDSDLLDDHQYTTKNANDFLTQIYRELTGSQISTSQLDQLHRFIDVLLAENSKYNLTAIRTRKGVVEKHIADAFTLLPTLDKLYQQFVERTQKSGHLETLGPRFRVLDLGSGAGIPGIIVSILRPHYHLTSLDATKKKCNFQRLVQQELTLSYDSFSVLWARAEDLGQSNNNNNNNNKNNLIHANDDLPRAQPYRESYDVVIARAVAELRVLAELALPLVKVQGALIAQKFMQRSLDEVQQAKRAVRQLGGGDIRVKEITTLKHLEDRNETRFRCLCIVPKERITPMQYPRQSGRPKSNPL